MTEIVKTRLPINGTEFQLYAFENDPGSLPDLALVLGDPQGAHGVLTRIHSECMTGDVFGSDRCDCGMQLKDMLAQITKRGAGVLVYLRQEGRGIGLMNKLRAYNLQDRGLDTVDANIALGHRADEREYTMAGHILKHLGVASIDLVTNNPLKLEKIEELGIPVNRRVESKVYVCAGNRKYLTTKQQKLNHLLALPSDTLS